MVIQSWSKWFSHAPWIGRSEDRNTFKMTWFTETSWKHVAAFPQFKQLISFMEKHEDSPNFRRFEGSQWTLLAPATARKCRWVESSARWWSRSRCRPLPLFMGKLKMSTNETWDYHGIRVAHWNYLVVVWDSIGIKQKRNLSSWDYSGINHEKHGYTLDTVNCNNRLLKQWALGFNFKHQ